MNAVDRPHIGRFLSEHLCSWSYRSLHYRTSTITITTLARFVSRIPNSDSDLKWTSSNSTVTGEGLGGCTRGMTSGALELFRPNNHDDFFSGGGGLSSRYTGANSAGTPAMIARCNCFLSSDRESSCSQNCVLFCGSSNWIIIGTSPSGKATIEPFRLATALCQNLHSHSS